MDEMDCGRVFNMMKPNYRTLDGLLGEWARIGEPELIRVFFDADASTAGLFNPMNEDLVRYMMSNHFMYAGAELINVAGHFRHFFWGRLGIPTDVAIFHSRIAPTGVEGYMSEHYARRTGTAHKYERRANYHAACMKLGANVAEFVPNVHIVDTGDLDPCTAPWAVMSKLSPTEPGHLNLVITNKRFMCQYASVPQTAVLTYRGVRSELFISNGLVQKWSGRDEAASLPPNMIGIGVALVGDKHAELKPIRHGIGPKKAVEMMLEAPDASGIETFLGRMETNEVEKKVKKNSGLTLEEKEKLVPRFETLNVFKSATEAQLAYLTSQMINKFDWKGLRHLNEIHFAGYPIHLEFAVDGEEYSRT